MADVVGGMPPALSRVRKEAPTNVVWEPLPGTSQVFALSSPAQQTLYTGTRGPGKTDTQLMRFKARVGIGYGEFWRGIILDREYKNLDDLVAKSKRWFPKFNDGAQWLSSNSAYKWVWPTGEELLFRTAKTEDDYWSYHGQEFPFIGWNELTKQPTDKLYEMFMSCNRSSFTLEKDAPKPKKGEQLNLAPIPLEVFSTTNPWGIGHAWVKSRFIDVAPYGRIVRVQVPIFNPQTQENEVVTRTQVAIFGSYKENKYLDPQYVATLESNPDANMRKAWLTGSWKIVSGGMFSSDWSDNTHRIPRMRIPAGWKVDRVFDWGSAHPFWVGWFATANGESLTYWNGSAMRSFTPARGSLILINEWYGTEKLGSNKGLELTPAAIAEGILKREADLKSEGWIAGDVVAGPADNQIRNDTRKDIDSIEKTMQAAGVRWTKSDKSQGSRAMGVVLMKARLKNAADANGLPGFYIMEHNAGAYSVITGIPRDPDNLDDTHPDAEDHPWDGIRYKVLDKAKSYSGTLGVTYPRAG